MSHTPIYVIAGKEDSVISIECRKLVDNLLEAEKRTTGLFNADPARVSASDVLDELRTLPFLTDKRVVLVKNADKFVSENRELLEKYFDNPCPTGILILTVSTWPAGTKLARKLTKAGKLISITQPKPWQLPARLSRYANDAHNKNLTTETAELLVELVGENLGQLYSEIDKLALFADNQRVITIKHIESLIGHNRLFNAFAVIDAVIAGRAAAAIEKLRSMFAKDKTTEFTVVGAFAFHFRRMFNAKALLDKGVNSNEVAKTLRLWGNKNAFFAQLQKVSLKQIGANLERLAKIDYEIKTGRTNAKIAVEQLVLRLLAS